MSPVLNVLAIFIILDIASCSFQYLILPRWLNKHDPHPLVSFGSPYDPPGWFLFLWSFSVFPFSIVDSSCARTPPIRISTLSQHSGSPIRGISSVAIASSHLGLPPEHRVVRNALSLSLPHKRARTRPPWEDVPFREVVPQLRFRDVPQKWITNQIHVRAFP